MDEKVWSGIRAVVEILHEFQAQFLDAPEAGKAIVPPAEGIERSRPSLREERDAELSYYTPFTSPGVALPLCASAHSPGRERCSGYPVGIQPWPGLHPR